LIGADRKMYPARNTVHLPLWRHRREIVSLNEADVDPRDTRAVQDLIAAAGDARKELVVYSTSVRAGGEPLGAVGFAPIEEILEMERPSDGLTRGNIVPTAADETHVNEIVRLDHVCFPWLWWNTAEEMARYVQSVDAHAWLLRPIDGNLGLDAYVAVTRSGTTGYVDRLAVAATRRSCGLGTALTIHAIDHLLRSGARRIALTTQHDNVRAQNLYSRLGFRPNGFRVTIWGHWIGQPRDRTP